MQIEYKNSKFDRGFGVEIEVGPEISKKDIGASLLNFELNREWPRMVIVENGPKGWAESRNNSYWHVKYDSSCGPIGNKIDHGWEIASFVGHNDKDLQHIAAGSQAIRELGCQVNNNCGLHYHVSVSDMGVQDVSIMVARWLKFEHILLQSVPPSRKKNKWCAPIRTKIPRNHKISFFPIDRPDRLWFWIKPKNLSIHENYDKRFALNVVNFARTLKDNNDRSTVELRLPECLLERDHIYYWGLWFINFVENCLKKSFPDDLDPAKNLQDALAYMGLAGEDGKFLILDGDLHDTKVWFLQRVVRNATLKKFAKQASDLLQYIQEI